MLAYFKLIRFPGLVIIALMQYAIRHCVIHPLATLHGVELQLSNLQFGILVFATICMAASGCIINDYFDTKADRINKKPVIVGRKITRQTSMVLHQILSGLSIICSGYLSYKIGHWQFSLLFFMAGGLLWFYSTSYKYSFLLGSFLISFLLAAIPFLVAIYEIPPVLKAYPNTSFATEIKPLLFRIGTISFFIFLVSLIKQFMRDLFSLKGDREIQRKSLSLVVGFIWTKAIIVFIIVLLSLSAFAVSHQFFSLSAEKTQVYYFWGLLTLPLLLLIYKLIGYKNGDSTLFGKFLLHLSVLTAIVYVILTRYTS